jgi:hypothetical protein
MAASHCYSSKVMVSCFVCDPTHEDLMTKLVHFMLVLDLLVLTHGLPSKCHSGVFSAIS